MADNYKGGADPIFTIMLLAIPVCWIIYGSDGLWTTICISAGYALFILGRGSKSTTSLELERIRVQQRLAELRQELADMRKKEYESLIERQKAINARQQQQKREEEEKSQKLAAAMDALENQDKISSESGSEVHISTIR